MLAVHPGGQRQQGGSEHGKMLDRVRDDPLVDRQEAPVLSRQRSNTPARKRAPICASSIAQSKPTVGSSQARAKPSRPAGLAPSSGGSISAANWRQSSHAAIAPHAPTSADTPRKLDDALAAHGEELLAAARHQRRAVQPSRPDNACCTASPTAATATSGERCAPPSGSATTMSTRRSVRKSSAVSRSASAARWACAESRHRIDAQASGGATA